MSQNHINTFLLVHLQNGHTTGARRGDSAELVQPEEKGGRLKMKETFNVEENAKSGGSDRLPLRERLAQRHKQKSGETDSPTSSTNALPKITTEDTSELSDRKPSESGGENRRMRLRMMYGSSIDKPEQEIADDMKKMNLSQSIAERKATSEKDKITEKDEKSKEDLRSKTHKVFLQLQVVESLLLVILRNPREIINI